MTPSMLVIASAVILFFSICFLQIPIALLLAALGLVGYALIDGWSNASMMLGNEVWETLSSNSLAVIPLFVFMGQICFHSGLSARLYRSLSTYIGHRATGIPMATLIACAGFSSICGSNTATAATMSTVALPELKKRGYHPTFSTGMVSAGTTLGAVIPPSVVAIILSMQDPSMSVRALFIGGIIPGLMLLLFFMATVLILAKLCPQWFPGTQQALGVDKKTHAIYGLLETFSIFGLVVGGLTVGFFTPSEAGTIGCMLAILMGFVSRGLNLQKLLTAARESLNISAMIFLLLAGAGAYGKFLSISRAPFIIANAVGAFTESPLAIILLIFAVLFVGSMIMDGLALLLITMPVFLPLVKAMHIDMVWFGLMLLVVTTMGAISPPVGATAFVVSGVSRTPLEQVFKGAACFLPAYFVCLAVMLIFPDFITFLPNMFAR